jgi:hypothetical protein
MLVLGAAVAGCDRPARGTAAVADAGGTLELSVRVPAALTLARALDTLTVGLDPASLATAQVAADPGMILGVESDVVVFPQGGERPAAGRHGYTSGTSFDVGEDTWSSAHDGLPVPGVKYVAEMQLVLFETDVPASRARDGWDPHAGKYRPLWARTLRQAEE